jgi:molybdopterin molybdotransferase
VLKISFDEALSLALGNVSRLEPEIVPIAAGVGRIVVEDVAAMVDSPSVDASVKDGFAVVSDDVEHASNATPVTLEVISSLGAGESSKVPIKRGTAIRILSGAPIPEGCDAVLADEFAQSGRGRVSAIADAHPGRNILFKGADVTSGEILARAGQELSPPVIGLLVAGGISQVKVARRPRVGLLATGNEVLLPGHEIEKGKLYASNVALQQAWFASRSVPSTTRIAKDSPEELAKAIGSMLAETDVIITSGGAWKGDRDLIIRVLESLGWHEIFHRIRLGPGKAVGMGILSGKPIFCLPGGPPSNEAAFLLIAFPAVCKMAGYEKPPFLSLTGRLASEVKGQENWTQVIHCRVEKNEASAYRLIPLDMKRRLMTMAQAQAYVLIPEGTAGFAADEETAFTLLDRAYTDC